jgi:ABC-2 type transport system ATP-binding protein
MANENGAASAGPAMIQVRDLTHFYGPRPAIDGVTFDVQRGEILGFLGPNGAGKTTTMRIITGFMPPTRGKVTVAGFDVVEQSLEARKRVGYLPETVPLYTEMTVTSYLKYMGSLRGVPAKRLAARIGQVIELCRLGDYRKTIIGKLSKGFRQRVGVAQAILHEPEVLVLDEPTIGIDPIQVVETRRLIQDLGREQTVVLSSHILPEVSMLCQRVLIIHQGRIVAEDTPQRLAQSLQGVERIEVDVRGPALEVAGALRRVAGVTEVVPPSSRNGTLYVVQARRGQDLRDEISKAIIGGGWSLLGMRMSTMSLEEIFLRLTTQEEQ